jgi:hypothetical protein
MVAMCKNKESENSDKILLGIQGTCLVLVLKGRKICLKVLFLMYNLSNYTLPPQ